VTAPNTDPNPESKIASDADWKFRQTAGQFARAGYRIAGALRAEQLVRCAEDDIGVSDASGGVTALAANASERSGFTVNVAAKLELTCQSCAERFAMPVDSRSAIFVARDAAELASWEDESFESIEVSEKTSALELVEDELLLAVPYVPRCKTCEALLDSGTPRVHEFN
jgi:large subunit ribosomal protein L32